MAFMVNPLRTRSNGWAEFYENWQFCIIFYVKNEFEVHFLKYPIVFEILNGSNMTQSSFTGIVASIDYQRYLLTKKFKIMAFR